jgi:chloride channel protein, CIC family
VGFERPWRFFDAEVIGIEPRVVGIVIGAGVVGGALGAGYLVVLHLLQGVLWPTTWAAPAVGFAVLGSVGLVIAFVVRLGGSPGSVELMVDNIHVSGSATGLRALRTLVPTSWLCIAAGGALGPEAPLVQSTGSLASWAAQRAGLSVRDARIVTIAGMAAGFTVLFGAPLGSAVFALEILHRRGLQYYEALLPAILGSLSGYAVFVLVTGADLVPTWNLPVPSGLRTDDLAWAVGAGVVGAGVAVVFTYLTSALRWCARRIPSVLRPFVGGTALAALGLVSSDALTFGEDQISRIIHTHGVTVAFFVLAAAAKLAGTSVTLASGWQGGFIIPLFFIGTCLGRAVHGLAPATDEAVMVAALMAASSAGVTKTPLGSTLVVSEMTGLRSLPTTLIATVVSFALTSQVGLIHTQREREPDQVLPSDDEAGDRPPG